MKKEFNFDKFNNYKNIYIAFASLVKEGMNEALLPMLENIDSQKSFDINETFFVYNGYEYFKSERYLKIEERNLLDSILISTFENHNNWDKNFTSKIVDFFVDKKVDFKHEGKVFVITEEELINAIENSTNKKELRNELVKKSNHIKDVSSVFNKGNEEIKKIKLLNAAYNNLEFSDFNELIKKHKILHFAVEKKEFNLINLLIAEKKVDVNLEDDKNSTPLLYANSLEAVKFIAQYEPNWFAVNAEGKDCVNCFSVIYDKEVSNRMISFAQNKMKENIDKSGLSEDFLNNKIKETLIDLIKTDKNKKELVDYLKKHKIKKFDDIKDEDGSSIAQMCLEKGNWAKYEVFKLEGLDQNNVGRTELDILLCKKNIKRANEAKKIFEHVVSKGWDIYKNFAFNVLDEKYIEKSYNSGSSILPRWIFEDERNGRSKELGEFLKTFVGEKQFIIDGLKKEDSKITDASSYSEKLDKEFYLDIYFLLSHWKLYGEKKLVDLDVESLLRKQRKYSAESDYYEIDSSKFDKFVKLIQVANNYDFFDDLHVYDFEIKLEEFVTKTFIKEFYKSKNKKDSSFSKFFSSNKDSLDYCFKHNHGIIQELITDDFIEFLQKEGKYLLEIAQAIKLDKELSHKKENRKVKGMKI